MFIDEVKVTAKAGHGGRGAVAFIREASKPKGGPSGGNGGRGGDVILVADHDLNNLIAQYYLPRLHAESGKHGMGKGMDGKAGANLVVRVPCGTMVWKLPENIEGSDVPVPDNAPPAELVADLVENGQQFVLCRGGRGGLGNRNFATARRQTPRYAQPGESGTEGVYRLELRLMADIGLVGYPNAGKSTLLSAISLARPKIASYPFTTLQPQIGIVDLPNYSRLTVCDVPGLMEGAHQNIGLGHAFLRHIKRCKALVLLLDMAGTDARAPWEDYKKLLHELEMYDLELVQKPRLVVANKMDEPAAKANLPKFKRRIRKVEVRQISAAFGEGLPDLLKAMRGVAESTTAAPKKTNSLPGLDVIEE